jgi:hypothetical protein
MRTAWFVAALAAWLIASAAPAGATGFEHEDFIDEDEIVMRFEDKKPGKLEGIRWQLNGVKVGAETVLDAKSRAIVIAGLTQNAFGVGRTPFRGSGEFSFSLTLGFLGNVGLTTSSLAAIEVDDFGSNPFEFHFLGVQPEGDDLEVTVNDENGVVGSPVVLPNTRLARVRIEQTATERIFDARSLTGGPWINVATVASPATDDVLEFSFGAALLNLGALVMFDDLSAEGGIFGPAEALNLVALYTLLSNLGLLRDTVVHEGNVALALATLGTFQDALLLAALGIELDIPEFLAFTQVALALKHLKTANREAGKVEKPLMQGKLIDALERLARVEAFVRLATLALRGMTARKIEELCYFEELA